MSIDPGRTALDPAAAVPGAIDGAATGFEALRPSGGALSAAMAPPDFARRARGIGDGRALNCEALDASIVTIVLED